MTTARGRASSRVFVGIEGNSIPRFPDLSTCYPTQMAADFGFDIRNHSISGLPFGQLDDTFDLRLAPYGRMTLATALHLVGGIQDYQNGATGAVVFSRMSGIATAARAAGYGKIIAATTTPIVGLAQPAEDERVAGNALVIANAGNVFDEVVNLAALLPNPADTAKYGDGVHPTTEGAGDISEAMGDATVAAFA